MKRRDHASVAAAIREAMAHGYGPVHHPDGYHVLSKGRDAPRLVVAREDRARSSVWHLVPEAELTAHLAAMAGAGIEVTEHELPGQEVDDQPAASAN